MQQTNQTNVNSANKKKNPYCKLEIFTVALQ